MVETAAPWWRGAVLYQIYPRSFQDSDGDGTGDLPGLLARLDHVASLGVDGVWISPFFRSPMADFGYDVSDFRAVDPVFGTLADADRVLARAHALGLKVLLDLPLNHTSDQHPWFEDSRQSRTGPRADWYVWADPKPDGTPPNNWLSVFGGSAWRWEPRRRQYYYHAFLPDQPDLDFHHPAVVEALLAEAEFWLARGADGFRLDTCNYYLHDSGLADNPPLPSGILGLTAEDAANPYNYQVHQHDKSRPENLSFLRRLRALVDRYPGAILLGEVHDDRNDVELCAEYTGSTDLLHTAYNFALFGEPAGPALIRATLERFEHHPAGGWPCWSLSNHDVRRSLSRFGGPDAPPALAKTLIAALGCLRGTLVLYQGEELGLPEAVVPLSHILDPVGRTFWPVRKGRDGCRTPMPWDHRQPTAGFTTGIPWLPQPAAHQAMAVTLQEADPDSVLAFTRSFLRLRCRQSLLRDGDITFLDAPDPVLALERRRGDEALLAVFNFGVAPVSWSHPAPDRAWQAEVGTGLPGTIDHSGKVVLPPYGGVIACRI